MASGVKRKNLRRKRNLASRKKVVLVVEGDKGKAEEAYFQLLNQTMRADIVLDVKTVPGQGEPTQVLKKAEMHWGQGDGDYICLVMDVDTHARLEDVVTKCRARRPQFYTAVTNPQFELWLLWHVEDQRAYISQDDLVNKVSSYGLVKGKRKKDLGDRFPIENYEEAIRRCDERACWELGKNPSSSIPWLIRALKSGVFPAG